MAGISRCDNPFYLPISNIKQSTDVETDGNYLIGKSFCIFLKKNKANFECKMVTKISLIATFLLVDGISKVKTNVQEKTSSASSKSSAKTEIKGILHLNSVK